MMAHYLELDSAFTSILLYDRGEIINKSVMQAEVFNAHIQAVETEVA